MDIILYICRRDPIDHEMTSHMPGDCMTCNEPLIPTPFTEGKGEVISAPTAALGNLLLAAGTALVSLDPHETVEFNTSVLDLLEYGLRAHEAEAVQGWGREEIVFLRGLAGQVEVKGE